MTDTPRDTERVKEIRERLESAIPLDLLAPAFVDDMAWLLADRARLASEVERLTKEVADYEILKRAVNSSAECLPECSGYGHAEECPACNPAKWLTIESLRPVAPSSSETAT